MCQFKVLVCLALLSGYSGSALAAEKCSCPAKKNLQLEFETSDVVLLGQVAEVKPKFPLHKDHEYVRLRITKKFKGTESLPKKESVVIYAPLPTDPCAIKFVKDNDYVIFAKGNPAFLKTNACDLSGMQEERVKELIELEKFKK